MSGNLAKLLNNKRAAGKQSTPRKSMKEKKRKVPPAPPAEQAEPAAEISDDEPVKPAEAEAAYQTLVETLSKRRKPSRSRPSGAVTTDPLRTVAGNAQAGRTAPSTATASSADGHTANPATPQIGNTDMCTAATGVGCTGAGTTIVQNGAGAADHQVAGARCNQVAGAPDNQVAETAVKHGDGAVSNEVAGAVADQGAGTKANGADAVAARDRNGADETSTSQGSESYDWEAHFRVELSSDRVAGLKQRLKFRELPAGPVLSGGTLAGRWLAAGCTDWPAVHESLTACGVKERVWKCWARMQQGRQQQQARDAPNRNSASAGSSAPQPSFVSEQQKLMFNLCNSYRDVLYPAHTYPTSAEEPDPLLDACLLHAANHVARCADLIRKNNARLEKDESGSLVVRDQGFTRPKVLLLLPMRNVTYTIGKRLLQLLLNAEAVGNAQGLAKFEEQFGPTESDDEDDDDAGKGKGGVCHAKPAEHQALFSGNNDDHFRLGLRITRGAVRLGAPIPDSDVILASPIALATALAEQGGNLDWLSSIEVLMLLRADVLAMQNWAHVEAVMQALNTLPKEQHNEDIMRVREFYLEGTAAHYRQTILLSSHLTPDILHLFNMHSANHAGCLRWQPTYTGVLAGIVPLIQQRFHRLDVTRVGDDAAVRWNAFTKELWPNVRYSSGGLLVFVSHYFDFVQLRNFLIAEDASFAAISDYSKPGEITRARARFFHRQRRVLLLTERAQFYHRLHIRGIQDCIFYGLPQHAEYYQEIFNMVDTSKARASSMHATANCLFSKWDALPLERVVGTKRAEKMLKGNTTLYMFC